jgi:hypothetical protein
VTPLLDHQAVKLSAREARQRQAVDGRQLAGDRLDLGDLLRGEAARAPRALSVGESREPVFAEPSPPLADALGRAVESLRDLGVGQVFRRVEDHPRPLHFAEAWSRNGRCARAPRAPGRSVRFRPSVPLPKDFSLRLRFLPIHLNVLADGPPSEGSPCRSSAARSWPSDTSVSGTAAASRDAPSAAGAGKDATTPDADGPDRAGDRGIRTLTSVSPALAREEARGRDLAAPGGRPLH